MSGLLKPKRTIENEWNLDWGVYLWQLPDKSFVQNSDGDKLVAGPCKENNLSIIGKMHAAARSLGITEGKPFFMPGFRKISQSEWEDQMERLIDGKVPDAADLYRQITLNGKSDPS